ALPSERSARRGTGRPGPLEIEATEMAGDVDDFADEKQAGDFAALHGFGGELVGGDTAGGDFGFLVALGSCGRDRPAVRLIFQVGEGLIRPEGWSVEIEPAVGEALREQVAQLSA